jgi:DNA-binding XRE family transcriptional regulator
MRPARAEARAAPVKTAAPARAANNVRALREAQLLTKAELARKAGISALTLARIESGCPCRVDTKRKIILALGLAPTDKHRVFGGGVDITGRKGR